MGNLLFVVCCLFFVHAQTFVARATLAEHFVMIWFIKNNSFMHTVAIFFQDCTNCSDFSGTELLHHDCSLIVGSSHRGNTKILVSSLRLTAVAYISFFGLWDLSRYCEHSSVYILSYAEDRSWSAGLGPITSDYSVGWLRRLFAVCPSTVLIWNIGTGDSTTGYRDMLYYLICQSNMRGTAGEYGMQWTGELTACAASAWSMSALPLAL